MFYLYHHNDLTRLAELFTVLRGRRQYSPLTEDTVLAPNAGIGRWLRIQVAEHEGVAANIRGQLPGEFIWQLLYAVMTDPRPAEHYEGDNLLWHLYLSLPAIGADVQAVAEYIGDPVDDVRRYQLARRLADVFDQYLIYRGDMLARWAAGETPASDPGRWQAAVWRWLTHADRLGERHRARVLDEFVTRLANERELRDKTIEHCPGTLYCFGLLAIPPDHLRCIYSLAEHIDVHFLLPNPSAAYWGDITAGRLPLELPACADDPPSGEVVVEAGHPLLSALGRMARDTLRVIYSDAFASMIEPELGDPMEYTRPPRDSLLHRVQADIVDLDCGNSKQGIADDDTSLDVHACHSALREVQVLQDQLLERLAAGDKRVTAGEIAASNRLAPRDVVVMLPDVAAYAPAIEAVFGGAPADRYLPFGLADRARGATHPIASTFSQLLDLPLSRWGASELLNILAVPAVMRRFALTASDLDTLEYWLQEAGVRWARDGAHRAELGAGQFDNNTWRAGLDRLLLGVAQSDDETLVDGVAPWSDLEGGATAALGKIWRFQTELADAVTELIEPATPGQWQTRLNRLVDRVFQPAFDDRDEQRAVESLRSIFAGFEAPEERTGERPLTADRRIGWPAVREHVRSALAASAERQPFLAGGITFCGMVPLRAVPFRVVCVLGMNDTVFPRQDTGRAFNAMFESPRLGDRRIRDDDRLLFLQALTAARDALHISYIGQDVHTGDELPPSPVVGELLAFVHAYYFRDWSHPAFERRLVHRQPMQPFSARYFDPGEPDPRVFTYAHDWRNASMAANGVRHSKSGWLDAARLTPGAPIQAIDLDTLTRFFDDPPRAFFEGSLGLNLTRQTRAANDREPIVLSPLDQSILRRRLFDRAVASGARAIATEPSALELARGELPPPPRASKTFAREADIVNALLPVTGAWHEMDEARETVAVDLDIASVRLTGRITDLGPTHLRRVTPGRLRNRYCLRQWIIYLALVAAGHERTLSLAGLSPKKDDNRIVAFEASIAPETAQARLAELVACFIEGQCAPIHFRPEMADDYKPDGDRPFASLWKRYSKSQSFKPSHLVDDVYFRLLLGDDDAPLGVEADNPFLAALETIWRPMHDALEPVELPTHQPSDATP